MGIIRITPHWNSWFMSFPKNGGVFVGLGTKGRPYPRMGNLHNSAFANRKTARRDEVQIVRVVFFEHCMVEQEERPLDIGAQVFYHAISGEYGSSN
jgi:hypothetical protein